MGSDHNSNWIVTVIKWVVKRNGRPKVTFCYSRSYRYEEYAMGRYDAIVEDLQNSGYVLTPLEPPNLKEEYFGYQGYNFRKKDDGLPTIYVTVFIDRNPEKM